MYTDRLKKIILRSHFAIIAGLISITVTSQNRATDSLFKLLKTDTEDTSKIHHLTHIAENFRRAGQIDTAFYFANKALTLSGKINFTKGLCNAHNLLGTLNHMRSHYSEALNHYTAAFKLFEKAKDKKGIAASYGNFGIVHHSLGNYPEALKNYLASLKLREELKDKAGMASNYNNIGLLYRLQSNYEEALKNLFAALKLKEELGDRRGMFSSLNNIGLVYNFQEKYEEALEKYQASQKICEEFGNKTGMATAYNNIGLAYNNLRNFPAALKNYSLSLKLKEQLGDRESYATTLLNIGVAQTKTAAPQKALMSLNEALQISISVGSKENIKLAYQALADLDTSRFNHDPDKYLNAFEHHKLYILYRDSLNNEQTRKKTIQSQMTYDFEKKEAVADAEHKKELESRKIISEEKNRKQKMILGFTVFGLLIVVVFAGFIFRSLRITRKQKKLIEEQKEEVTKQKEIVDEKQKEILDSIYYALRIQRALITNEKYFSKNLNRISKN